MKNFAHITLLSASTASNISAYVELLDLVFCFAGGAINTSLSYKHSSSCVENQNFLLDSNAVKDVPLVPLLQANSKTKIRIAL